jgi:hypothetical protein
MDDEPKQVTCPHHPDHGIALQRWLLPAEREVFTSDALRDVFEIDCPFCGAREYQDDHSVSDDTAQ